MKKLFNRHHQFGIQKKVTGRTEKLIPVVMEPGFMSQWRPIVKLYDTYTILDYEPPQGLSRTECENHIKGYQEQIEQARILATKSEAVELVDPNDIEWPW